MRNMQLAVFSVLCASPKEQFETLFFERNPSTATGTYWILVFLRANTGLLVAVIIQQNGQWCEGVNVDSLRYFGIVVHFYHSIDTIFWLGATMAVTAGYL